MRKRSKRNVKEVKEV